MIDNMGNRVLLIGASAIAIEYGKVLNKLRIEFDVYCRSEKSALMFYNALNLLPKFGGIENANLACDRYQAAIIASGIEVMSEHCKILLNKGFKKILLEKPGGLNFDDVLALNKYSKSFEAEIYLGYNRHFFQSVKSAKQIINREGLLSISFEFTEWGHIVEKIDKSMVIKKNWFFANSTHILDLVLFFGGSPKKLNSYSVGHLAWHDKAIFAGAGITESNIVFSYHANWNSAGRWGIELLTNESRLILRPIEKLQIQYKGEININEVYIEDEMDKLFMPGLYHQVESFLSNDFVDFFTLDQHSKHIVQMYYPILEGCS